MNNQIICYKVTSPWVCSSLIGDPVFSALVSTEPLWDYELWQVWGPHMQYWQKIVTFNRNLVQWMDCFSNSSSACRLLFCSVAVSSVFAFSFAFCLRCLFVLASPPFISFFPSIPRFFLPSSFWTGCELFSVLIKSSVSVWSLFSKLCVVAY